MNPDKLRAKMEKNQEIANRNAAFIATVVALAALGSFLVEPTLEYMFPHEDKATGRNTTTITHYTTNAPNAAVTNFLDHTRQ